MMERYDTFNKEDSMAKIKKLVNVEKVPENMQDIFRNITQITDSFSEKHLNKSYASLLRKLAAALCRKRPSPLLKGNLNTWIAGMVHALGMVNFLFDKSQTPHVSSTFISEYFGLGQSTVSNKSKQVRELMKMSHWNSDWMLPERIEDSPMVWMISINGLIMDSRYLPRHIQEEAFEKGLIPYLPTDTLFEN